MTPVQQHAATDPTFDCELRQRIDEVFRTNPRLPDHRTEYPWVTAHLGDPHAPVWFVAEYPSLTQLEREGTVASVETQWNVSVGDRLFPEMLALLHHRHRQVVAPSDEVERRRTRGAFRHR